MICLHSFPYGGMEVRIRNIPALPKNNQPFVAWCTDDSRSHHRDSQQNPCLTFVTPTLLAGDRSLTDVVAHEIAHRYVPL